jgi:hypothetical protein
VSALPNDFGGHVTNWLNKQGYAIPAPPAFSFDPNLTGATSTHDRGIIFSREWQAPIQNLATRYGKRGRMDKSQVGALQTLLHEMLHQPLVHREPDWYNAASNDQRLWEEAAANQAASDLLPAAAKQLFGFHYQPPRAKNAFESSHPAVRDRTKRQRAYRQWSTLSSGSKNYQDRAARLARRKFLNASTADRATMLAAPR